MGKHPMTQLGEDELTAHCYARNDSLLEKPLRVAFKAQWLCWKVSGNCSLAFLSGVSKPNKDTAEDEKCCRILFLSCQPE